MCVGKLLCDVQCSSINIGQWTRCLFCLISCKVNASKSIALLAHDCDATTRAFQFIFSAKVTNLSTAVVMLLLTLQVIGKLFIENVVYCSK